MGLFDTMLKDNESLFKNELALDHNFIPKLIPFRESQQQEIARCIRPLLENRNGHNMLVHGPPGVGKTVAVKHIFNELEETNDTIFPLFVNCWQKNTTYKIAVELCTQLGYKYVMNKNTDELFKIISNLANKGAVVFCFDEIDKVEDFDFLYILMEEIFRKSIIMITNFHSWLGDLDRRIKSRMTPEELTFAPYNEKETIGILSQRIEYAFVPDVLDDAAFMRIAKTAHEANDIRMGLFLLKEAGLEAEYKASKKILPEHAEKAIQKMAKFNEQREEILDDDIQKILNVVKQYPEGKIGEIFKAYENLGGKTTYKTFQRKIDKLHKQGLITVRKTKGGMGGNTTIISYKEKKLTDF